MNILNWLNCHKDKFIHPGWWCPGFLAHYSTDITASRKSSHPSVNEMELWPPFSLNHSTLSPYRLGLVWGRGFGKGWRWGVPAGAARQNPLLGSEQDHIIPPCLALPPCLPGKPHLSSRQKCQLVDFHSFTLDWTLDRSDDWWRFACGDV